MTSNPLPTQPNIKVPFIKGDSGLFPIHPIRRPVPEVAITLNPEQQRKGQAIKTPQIRVEYDENEQSHTSVSVASSKQAGKKRGRKLTEEEKYRKDSILKIDALKIDLQKKGLNVAQRQKIRNQISAQQSRLKKKDEFSDLKRVYDDLKT